MLRDFVLAMPDAALFLLVDADVVFTAPGTVATMRADLEQDAAL